MNYTTKQIAEITQSQLIGDKDLPIQHIAFDSRNIYSTHKTAFIAIRDGSGAVPGSTANVKKS